MVSDRVFPKFRNILSTFTKNICIALFVVMLGIIVLQVLLRAFQIPVAWAQELSLYIMIALALLGSVFVMHERGHLRVDLIINKLPKKLQIVSEILILLIQASLMLVVVWYSFGSLEYASNVKAISLGVSMVYPYLVIPIAFFLMFLETVFQILDASKSISHNSQA